MMITFKEFLLEKALTKIKKEPFDFSEMKSLDDLDGTEFSNFKESLKNGSLLFRGVRGKAKPKIHVLNPQNGVRTSRDTNNLYQLFMDNSPAFNGIPSRSKSLITTTSFYEADYYGSSGNTGAVYVVVPQNGTTVATSSVSDFMVYECSIMIGSTSVYSDLKEWSKMFEKALKGIGVKPTSGKYLDFEAIKTKYLEVQKNDPELLKKLLTRAFEKKFSIQDAERSFNDIMNFFTPKSLQVGTVKAGSKIANDRECWFSNKCLLIPSENVISLINKYIKDDGGDLVTSYRYFSHL